LIGVIFAGVKCRADTKTLQEICSSAYNTEVIFNVPRATTVSYKVKSGDTLLALSHRFYTTAAQIRKLNRIKGDIIVTGRSLKIPTFKTEPVKMSLGKLVTDTQSYSDPESIDSRALGLIRFVEECRNVPYKWGGESFYGIDCSGLVALFYRRYFNIQLPHSSMEQSRLGEEVRDLTMGDLLFFAIKRKVKIDHVGIYVGNGKFIHAASREKKVAISSLEDSYYRAKFITAQRIFLPPNPVYNVIEN